VDKKAAKKSDGVYTFTVFHIFNTPYYHNNYNQYISFRSLFGFASESNQKRFLECCSAGGE
jgi:hypothetical protein